MELRISHLYPRLMNIYGDRGNLTTLAYRAQQREIKVSINQVKIGDPVNPQKTDLLFGGGGQDRQQLLIAPELQKRKSELEEVIEAGKPVLLICGSYQLFGHYFKTINGEEIPGIGLFDLHTVASPIRKIGNVIIETSLNLGLNRLPKTLVGFENHSGHTFLGKKCQPLGRVLLGFGNNGHDKSEGAVYRQAIGTYLHGPLLPKNPHLADYLILSALQQKYQLEKLAEIDDHLEWETHHSVIRRARQLSRRFPFLPF